MLEERKVTALNGAHIMPFVSATKIWSVTAAPGVFPDDLLEPSYWKHVANEMLKEREIIWAVAQDGTWWAAYMVLHVGNNSAKLKILFDGALDEVADADVETHNVKWTNMHSKWVVKRILDNDTIKDKFSTKELAVAWLKEHVRQLAA